jgi:exodeoxyribonuclease VII large subunit
MVKQKCLSLDAKLQRKHPISILEQYSQRLDLALQGMKASPREYVSRASNRINVLNACLIRSSPLSLHQNMQSKVTNIHRRLIVATQGIFSNTEQLFSVIVAKLDGTSPLNVLGRGYAYVVDPDTQRNIKSVRQIKVGSTIKTRLKDGSFGSEISSVDPIEPKIKH